MTLSPNGYLQFRCEVREADQELLKAYCAIAEALRNSRYVERVDVEDGGDDA